MQALVLFAHVAAGNTFTTAEIHPAGIEALGCDHLHYTLASLRYDFIETPRQGSCRHAPQLSPLSLLPQGYSICLVFLKLLERVRHSPQAFSAPSKQTHGSNPKRSLLDRLYQRVVDDLDTLIHAVGLKPASQSRQTRTKYSLHPL